MHYRRSCEASIGRKKNGAAPAAPMVRRQTSPSGLVVAFVPAAARLGRPPFRRQLRPLVLARADAVFLFVFVSQLDELPDATTALLAGGDVLVVCAAASPPRAVLGAALTGALAAV